MSIQFINPEGMMKSPAFSQAVTTQGSGKTIYIGGQNAVNEKGEMVGKGDIALQTEQVMKNIGIALEACGAGYKDIIKLNIYILQGEDAMKAFKASQQFTAHNPNPPIITVVFVAGLNPGYLLEIDGVAFVD